MRRPAFIAGFSFLFALIIANYLNSVLFCIIVIALAIALLFISIFTLRKTKFFSFTVIILSSIIVSLSSFAVIYHFFCLPDLKYEDLDCEMKCELVEEPYLSGDNFVYIVKPLYIKNADINGNSFGKVKLLSKTELSVTPFDTFKCEIGFYKSTSYSLFDYKTFDRSRGINLVGKCIKFPFEITKPSGIKNPYYYAIQIRKYFSQVCDKYIGKDEGEFVKGIVIGDKADLSKKINNDVQISGLSHIMAVSGMNLTFFIGFLLMLFDLLTIKRKITYIVCISSAIVIATVAGLSGSVVRALIMLIIFYGGMLFFKESDTVNSLGASVLILCLISPFSAVDVSILLSTFATLGIILLSKPITNKLIKLFKVKKINFFNATVFGAFSTSVSAAIFTAPFVALAFGYLSFVSLLANLLAVFPVSVVFLMGVFTSLFSFFYYLAVIPAFICKICSMFLIKLCSILASFNYSYIYSNRWYLYLFSAIIILFVMYKYLIKNSVKFRSITVALVALAFFISCFTFDLIVLPVYTPLKIKVIDVGQADSIAIIKDKRAILIDAGGVDNAYNNILEELNADGLVTLEAVIVTHYDYDHVCNMPNIILKARPKAIILPPNNISDKKYKKKITDAAEAISVLPTFAENDLLVNALKGIKIEVLTKHIDKELKSGDDQNNSSLVVKVQGDNFTSLLLGDMDSSVWKLVKCYESYLDCDIIKVGHHGSANSITDDLLKYTTPLYSIISVGTDNMYHLPSNDTIAILKQYNIPIYRTDFLGSITATFKGSNPFIISEKGDNEDTPIYDFNKYGNNFLMKEMA